MAITAVKTSNPLERSPLVKESQRFIAHAFFGTILKQMHNSPWRSELFSGGQAGRNFQALLNDRLADRLANNAASRKLVQSMVRKLEKKAGAVEIDGQGSGGDGLPSRAVSRADQGGFSETALSRVGSTRPTADPVDAVVARAAEHLGFLSQAPRIDLKG